MCRNNLSSLSKRTIVDCEPGKAPVVCVGEIINVRGILTVLVPQQSPPFSSCCSLHPCWSQLADLQGKGRGAVAKLLLLRHKRRSSLVYKALRALQVEFYTYRWTMVTRRKNYASGCLRFPGSSVPVSLRQALQLAGASGAACMRDEVTHR